MGEQISGWFTEFFQDQGTAFSLRVKAKLHEEQSELQRIRIYETETFGRLMVLDDCIMLTQRDNFLYHEMMTHPALFTHAYPKDVVVIGGGDCGTLQEVLKHSTIKQVWQVEIDQRVTQLAKEYFPDLCQANNDPRANFFFGDGVQWIADAEPDSADLIIVDSTDPVGPAAALFSTDFYRNCLLVLREGGLLVQQSESPLLHSTTIIKQIQLDMKQAGFSHVHTLPFPQPVYPTGWWSCTLAGKNKQIDVFREADATNRPFLTDYYNVAIHRAALAVPEFMRRDLESSQP